MITLKFQHIADIYKVRIFNKQNIWFSKLWGQQELHSSLDGLQLSLAGILKHFPDLEGKEPMEIRKEAIKRFKEKILNMNTELDIAKYIIEDLGNYGYKCLTIQRAGWREVNYHGEIK